MDVRWTPEGRGGWGHRGGKRGDRRFAGRWLDVGWTLEEGEGGDSGIVLNRPSLALAPEGLAASGGTMFRYKGAGDRGGEEQHVVARSATFPSASSGRAPPSESNDPPGLKPRRILSGIR